MSLVHGLLRSGNRLIRRRCEHFIALRLLPQVSLLNCGVSDLHLLRNVGILGRGVSVYLTNRLTNDEAGVHDISKHLVALRQGLLVFFEFAPQIFVLSAAGAQQS